MESDTGCRERGPSSCPRTLRGRLSLVALLAAALLILVLTVAFDSVVRHRLQHQADDELRTRAAAVATTVDTRGTGVRVLESATDALLDADVWIYADRHPLEQPPAAGRLTRVADAPARHGGQRCVTATVRRPLRFCSQPVPGAESRATVVTSLDLSPYRSSADTLLLGSLALDAVMLACTYALTRLAVGRALRPVRTMIDQATQWSAVASGERFGSIRHPAELARLGGSLDALLDRIRTLLRYERQLTGELSHELRTPLSRIVAELDTRAGGLAAPGTAEVLPALRALVQVPYTPSHLTITADGPHLMAGVGPVLLERIVSPLLANAYRYAVTTVTVRAHGGAGLGLPPARRLARSAGGEVTYDSEHAPGAPFVVSLPAG